MSIGLPGTGPGFAGGPADAAPAGAAGRWRILALLSLAELLGMSLWFAATAVAPQLAARWHLTPAETGWLTGIVQLGFVAGTATAAILNLADIIPARRYFAWAACFAAIANAGLLWAPHPGAALFARFLVGFFLAGVYPPGMKMVATWFRLDRGLAIGTLVGALAIGKGTPYLVHAMKGAGLEAVILVASAGALLAALLVGFGYRDGPHPFERRPFEWSLVATVLRHRETRLAIGGYLGHMWELYAMWTWLPAFLAASFAARAAAGHAVLPSTGVDVLAFAAIAAGGLGCVWGGWAARRMGYARVVTLSMAVSGACAATIGLAFGAPVWLILPVVLIWGWFVVADSAQFSAMVTVAAPAHAVGTALTLQTSIGFLLTLGTIQLVPFLVERVGWPWAFPVLALGPVLGIGAIARLPKGPLRTPRLAAFAGALLVAGLALPADAGDPRFRIETVDVEGHMGGITSLVFDARGNPHISYMNYDHHDLRYASRDAHGWSLENADSAGMVGGYSGLVLDTLGDPLICYLEIGKGDLQVAGRTRGVWTQETVDSIGNVGWHTSFVRDRAGSLHISYYDVTRADLKYATRMGGRWVIETVDSTGDVGRFSSLALDAGGRAHISYYDAGRGDLRWARRTGDGWRIDTVDARGVTGMFTSLALDRDGHPRISYHDKLAGDLKLAWKAEGRWSTTIVDSTGNVGAYTSLAFDRGGRPCIGYTDLTHGDVKFARASRRLP